MTHKPSATRHWWHAGSLLPAAAMVLLGLQAVPAHSEAYREQPQADQPFAERPPVLGLREPPRSTAGISVDQVIAEVERRYKARVVRVNQVQVNGRLIYELRLLSEEGWVKTVRVDAETGRVI